MYLHILFITFSFLLLSCQLIHSQIITVYSELTGEPIENVALFNVSQSVSTLTNRNGLANISFFEDNDSIFFQHPSYFTVARTKKDLIIHKQILLSRKIIEIEEFIISAGRFKENTRDVPYMTDILQESTLGLLPSQSSADILLSTGNISVQKSQGGGGSPILRGFEANKILLIVDGVRMNNAIYRSGHLQNSITIDHAMLERVEIFYGPTSLIHGSDALGGVIHYYTRDPHFSDEKEKINFKVRVSSQYSTANKGNVNHLSFNTGFDKLAFLTSITHKKLGDGRMGKNSFSSYGNYGKLFHYVRTINGMDSTIANPDPYIQKKTAYSQTDIIQKISYSLSQNADLTLNLQYSTSSKINRYDELNDYNGLNMNYSEYYYGPQNRLFASLKTVVRKNNFFFSSMTSTFAYQRIDEDRISRRFRNNNKLFQEEDVNMYTWNIDFLQYQESKRRFNYGFEGTMNDVISTAWYKNIQNGEFVPAQTRYPDGGSQTWSAAAYIIHRWKPSEKLLYSAGMRYHYGSLKSKFSQAYIPYEEINIKNGALTGSVSCIFHPGNTWQISTIASTGFRNPNVDDYGKVRAKDNLVTVPNPDLKAEYTWNLELGISKSFEGYFTLSGNVYYTWLKNAITRTDFRLNNSDSLLYDGEWYKIITNSNAGEAYIRGISLSLISDVSPNFIIKSTLTFTQGFNISDNEPMGHIPPVFGRNSVTYSTKKFNTDFYMDYNGWKRIGKMSTFGEDNAEEGTIDGFPGWFTLNLRTGYSISNQLKIIFALENILDYHYKPFASALAGTGRNLIFTLRADF